MRGVLGLSYYAEIARTAERALMDSIFLADNIAIPEYRVTHLPQTQFDPVAVLSALVGITSRIGLIATGSTTYSKPWDLARRFATLDHLSGGRAGWNIVTTSTPLVAAIFGEDGHPEHADRYARAHEFVDVVQRTWDSWEDDAVTGDRERGVWGERGKLHAPRFRGGYYDVEGIPPFPRSPQGWPVLVQAGQSAAGIGLAARYAELVFSGPPSLGAAITFRAEPHRQAAAAAGRDPGQVLVLPALMITLGRTEAEARARAGELDELASPEFRWQNLLYMTGHDPELGPESVRRHPGAARRPHRRLAGRRRRRRIHDHGLDSAARADRVRRPGRARLAGPRALPHRVLAEHAARSPRPQPPGRLPPPDGGV